MKITQKYISDLLDTQKIYFKKGGTLSVKYRIEQLDKLYNAIVKYEQEIQEALYADLGKNKFEAYTSEIGIILNSITNAKKNLPKWTKPIKAKTPIYALPSASYVQYTPYGSALIIGPYNYPFQLVMEPLIGAICAGNCAVLCPSELTPNVADVIDKIIKETFHIQYISCVKGGIENTTMLINSPFDYIFFTGSPQVGKIVMKAAAEKLIPVTLELGGKSPVVIDRSAKLKTACQRIVWGKFMNVGQTCVAPDYVLVDNKIKAQFINEIEKTIRRFYGNDVINNKDYGRIVNEKHIERLKNIIEKDFRYVAFGGKFDKEKRYIAPTIICPPDGSAACMQEEIFGPILPVIGCDNLDEAIDFINKRPKPLALYIFSENKKAINKTILSTSSGGVCVNDVVSHIINPQLPFGGIGQSGMGAYHGKESFLTFSHKRSVLKKSTAFNPSLIFPPFNDFKLKAVKKVFK